MSVARSSAFRRHITTIKCRNNSIIICWAPWPHVITPFHQLAIAGNYHNCHITRRPCCAGGSTNSFATCHKVPPSRINDCSLRDPVAPSIKTYTRLLYCGRDVIFASVIFSLLFFFRYSPATTKHPDEYRKWQLAQALAL